MAPLRYADADIMEAQDEVLTILEQWAKTAWQVRSRTENVLLSAGIMQTQYVPVVTISSWTLNGTSPAIGSYTVQNGSGLVKFGDWSFGVPSLWPYQASVMTYTYGFSSVPRLVKSACIKATRSLLDEEEGRTKLPPNTTRYSSERTDIELDTSDDIEPWPWDAGQSARLRAYWGRRRPRTYISV